MARTYHGKNTYAIKPLHEEEFLVIVQAKPADHNFIKKIVDTHSHTAIPVQLDPNQGLLGFYTLKDKYDTLLSILENIPRPLKVLETCRGGVS